MKHVVVSYLTIWQTRRRNSVEMCLSMGMFDFSIDEPRTPLNTLTIIANQLL